MEISSFESIVLVVKGKGKGVRKLTYQKRKLNGKDHLI